MSAGRADEVRTPKIATVVASRLRQQIASGELKEGDWLPTEPELTVQFGVSRPTLREAFRLLESDGLIRIRRGPPGGAQVQVPGPAQAAGIFGLILTLSGTTLRDVYEARMVIEPEAVRMLVVSSREDQISALRDAVDLAREVADDDAAFSAATTAFHASLVEQGGNQALSAVFTLLSTITERHLALSFRERRQSARVDIAALNRRALAAFDRLLDLIEARDEAAPEYWARHMKIALEHVLHDDAVAKQVIDVLD